MQDLTLVGVHEDGQYLLLSNAAGEHFRVSLDEPLRAAARSDRARLGQQQSEQDSGMRPRDVQSLVRGGLTAEEVAERSGWTIEKVRSYEVPILAEREYVAGLAREIRLAPQGARLTEAAPTLEERVAERMSTRDVTAATVRWDAWRQDSTHRWTVVITFSAGGRERQASWHFDPSARTVAPSNDEARWLSEDEHSLASRIPSGGPAGPARKPAIVYDVEAEGGLDSPAVASRRTDPADLMTAMRERSSARGRRTGSRRSRAQPTALPGDHPDDALPLEAFTYDPAVDGAPPPAHDRPAPADVPPTADVPPPADVPPTADTEPTLELHPDEPTREQEGTTEMANESGPRGEPADVEPADPTDMVDRGHEAAPAPTLTVRTDERSRPARPGRASVPRWDDIVFGTRPKSSIPGA